jgi:hypothetical protein
VTYRVVRQLLLPSSPSDAFSACQGNDDTDDGVHFNRFTEQPMDDLRQAIPVS